MKNYMLNNYVTESQIALINLMNLPVVSKVSLLEPFGALISPKLIVKYLH